MLLTQNTVVMITDIQYPGILPPRNSPDLVIYDTGYWKNATARGVPLPGTLIAQRA